MAEVDLWLTHIDERVATIEADRRNGKTRLIEEAELVFAVCVVFNRLAQIDLRTSGHVQEDSQLIPWVMKNTGWPKDVVKGFWKGIRNPTMHMGRSFGLASYDIQVKEGHPPLVATIANDLEWEPTEYSGDVERGDGWDYSSTPLPGGDRAKLVTFYMPGIRRALAKTKANVVERLHVASSQELDLLLELNRRLPFMYVHVENGEKA